MARPSSLAERVLISLVRDGQWVIDDHGRIWRTCVRSGLKNGGSHLIPVKPRRVEHRLPHGYLQVRAEINGGRYYSGAHRLVWQDVHGDIPHGHEINHKNGLKDDNRPENLLCGTAGANVAHAHRAGLIDQHGQKNPAAKLTDNQIAQIRNAYAQGDWTMDRLAERFGVRFQHISRVVRGQRRPKQGGPVAGEDLRHSVCDRDAETGRFVGKKAAGRLLDGREWNEFPGQAGGGDG